MSNTIDNEVKLLFESSWSRVLSWINNYDIATISAFRSRLKDVTEGTFIPKGKEIGDSFTLQENRARNREMKAKLLSWGYGVTNIHGSWIEGINGADSIEVGEESFFVVNLNNDEEFCNNLFKLSEYYNQDSFLYKLKNEENAYLWGTNNSEYPGYKNKDNAGTLTSLPSKFMSRIKNAAFAFVKKDQWIKHDEKSDLTNDEMNDYEHSYSWRKDEKPTFAQRKEYRTQKLRESEDYEHIKKNNGITLETIKDYEPFTRQSIGSVAAKVKFDNRRDNKSLSNKEIQNIVKESTEKAIATHKIEYIKKNKIDESGINRIMSHGDNGFVVVSANRSDIASENENCDLTKYFEKWCSLYHKDANDDKWKEQWLYRRNKLADKKLKDLIVRSNFTFSPVYGGYHGQDSVVDSFEPSYIVYAKDRKGETIPFEKLLDFAKEMCSLFHQESVYVQAPNQSPIYIDKNGNQCNSSSSKNFKLNREKEEFFTTAKRDKGNKKRFTADIVFECMYHNGEPYCYGNRIKRAMQGEIFLKG